MPSNYRKMSFMYRSPAVRSSCTPSDATSSSTRTSPSTDASSYTTCSSPYPDPCFNLDDDYELETELLVAVCAVQQDDDCPEDEDINKRIKFSDNRILWEDNSVYMNRDQSSLDRIAKAQKLRNKIDEKERRQKRKEKKSKIEREEPKFYDFMADVRSSSRAEKMPSWTHEELSLWSEELGTTAIAEPGKVEQAEEEPSEDSVAVDSPANVSELADTIVTSITVPTVTEPLMWSAKATARAEIVNEPNVKSAKGPTTVKPEPVKQQLPVEPMLHTPTSDTQSRCAIRPIPGKGLGVIATTNINQGQAIITESPFLTVDHPPHTPQITSRLSRLPQKSQDLFHSFQPTHAPYHPNRLIDIVATNIIPLGGDVIEDLDDEVIAIDADGEVEDRCRSGLFETICRVNHSCAPNSQWTWFEAGHMILRALRPIAKEEEITACYLQDTSLGYTDRQQALFETWRFKCDCSVCSLPPLSQAEDDDRRSRFREIRDSYINIDDSDTWQSEGLIVCSNKIKKAVKLLEEGKQYEEIAHCRWSLFILSARWGDEEKAKREGSAWLRQMAKMGDVIVDQFRAQVKRPRSALDWGMYDDDGSGDESECDTEDDFATTHCQIQRIRFERAQTLGTSRPIKRNPIRTATTAGVWS